ncbi:MAG: hypothetical protein ACFFDD_15650 [Promethearchaeota archaeon]
MNVQRLASIYSIFVGISMIGLWVMLLTTDQVPELALEPYRIMAHILAEVVTAVLLLVSGYGLLTKQTWGLKIFLFAQGALFYTLIASPGYYVQLGFAPMVVMFSVLLVITLIFIGFVISRPEKFEN